MQLRYVSAVLTIVHACHLIVLPPGLFAIPKGRVRPGGRIWTSGSDSMYQYVEAACPHLPYVLCGSFEIEAGSLRGIWRLRLGVQGPANGRLFKGTCEARAYESQRSTMPLLQEATQDEEDPYLVLDVPRGSDRATIGKAYRRPQPTAGFSACRRQP